MTLLEIVQRLHYEAKLPGSPPSAVTGQAGRAADLVRWAIDAYNDIQREKDGRWKWLRADFTLDTTASDGTYAYSDCTDVEDAAAISRFRSWHLDQNEPPLIYRVSDGKATEAELVIADWPEFRRLFVKGTHTADFPRYLSVDPAGNLRLGPTPDGIYRVSGPYWRGNQTLAADGDTPEMPADFHMLIPYRALTKYAYNVVGQEILARAQADGQPLWNALVLNQSWARSTLYIAGPLA